MSLKFRRIKRKIVDIFALFNLNVGISDAGTERFKANSAVFVKINGILTFPFRRSVCIRHLYGNGIKF